MCPGCARTLSLGKPLGHAGNPRSCSTKCPRLTVANSRRPLLVARELHARDRTPGLVVDLPAAGSSLSGVRWNTGTAALGAVRGGGLDDKWCRTPVDSSCSVAQTCLAGGTSPGTRDSADRRWLVLRPGGTVRRTGGAGRVLGVRVRGAASGDGVAVHGVCGTGHRRRIEAAEGTIATQAVGAARPIRSMHHIRDARGVDRVGGCAELGPTEPHRAGWMGGVSARDRVRG